MGKKTSRIQSDIEKTREHMTELLDELTDKLDVRSFAKRNAVLLGSVTAAAGLAIGVAVRRMMAASGKDSGEPE